MTRSNAPMRKTPMTKACWLMMVLSLIGATSASAEEPTLEILGTPTANEPVTGRLWHPDCTQLGAIRHGDGVFRIYVDGTLCSIPIPGRFSQDFTLGQLPAGRYLAQLVEGREDDFDPISDVVSFEVKPVPEGEYPDDRRGLYDEGGIWSNSELLPGESFFVEHATASDRLYIVWNTYLPDGSRDWRILLCVATGYGDRDCEIYTSTPSRLTAVGTAKLTSRSFWTYDDRMVLELPEGNATRVIPLFRFAVER
jgi:hypothetical protein